VAGTPESDADLAARLDRVAARLARLAARWRAGTGPDAAMSSHGYRLGPPLAAAVVDEFERRHGISLPADYRAFLTRVGNGGPGRHGGAGPAYGLLPLAEWNVAFVSDGPYDDLPGLPFPVVPDRRYGDDWLAEAGLDEDGEWYPGTIALAEAGCGTHFVLVVTGPARGRVACTSDHVTNAPTFVSEPDFLTWYEHWLWSA
jgi:hypothetical protein